MKDPDESPDVLHCKHCLPQDVSSSLKEAPSLVLCNVPKSDGSKILKFRWVKCCSLSLCFWLREVFWFISLHSAVLEHHLFDCTCFVAAIYFHQVRCVLPSASLMACLASARQSIFHHVNFFYNVSFIEIDSEVLELMVTAMCWNRFWRCNFTSVTCLRRKCQSPRACLKDNLEIRKEINELIQAGHL